MAENNSASGEFNALLEFVKTAPLKGIDVQDILQNKRIETYGNEVKSLTCGHYGGSRRVIKYNSPSSLLADIHSLSPFKTTYHKTSGLLASSPFQMYAASMMSLARLPYDLERTILEYAARADRPMALTLLLVSREVKRWIEPILYRHVTLNNNAQTDAFIRALDSPCPRSPQFFANIRSISFTYGVTFHQAAKILSVCSNITSLSCHIEFSRQSLNVSLDDIDNFRCFMTTSSPTLERLSVTLHPFIICPDPDFRVPVLQNLSHLCISGSSINCHKWLWRGLDTLKHLTHLALEIDTSTPLQAIYNLGPHFPPLLHVCLVVISVKKIPIREYLAENKEIQQLVSGDTDRRIVVGTSETLETLGSIAASGTSHLIQMTQWEDILGDRTAWEEAEKIIRYRMRNSGEVTL